MQGIRMNQNSEFDIVTLIELAKRNKYEKAVAGFHTLDRIERLELPKKIKSRKLAVQAMFALASEEVQYQYFTKEERIKLDQEANLSNESYSKFNGLFEAPQAPIAEEDTEEDFIPEEAPRPILDGDEEDEDSLDDEDDDEEDDDDDDEDDDEDDEEEEDED
ncbi:DNA primase [Leptospira borgpetersenii serovar Hardjo-bovis]|nr:DNA primase [Leptospira borgpetersenii serovar Hardjo-bovis]MBE8360839.1 DNA primase [Leptospira borgpetersenii serovar Hardjo-bovis]MBE8370470.1 DNA primase [Leptospira borgpetersenii serovar Hardjo-bovis]MBE8373514.1 DNA primase [Leptospira borgpetersenii serovar Hardjo-bovis]MBE8376641.1 DNA primase [Leptospira borgpetersenii serovar Hardjo-bovis]